MLRSYLFEAAAPFSAGALTFMRGSIKSKRLSCSFSGSDNFTKLIRCDVSDQRPAWKHERVASAMFGKKWFRRDRSASFYCTLLLAAFFLVHSALAQNTVLTFDKPDLAGISGF